MALDVKLLGVINIQLDGKTIQFGRNKALALFAYLAIEPQQHTRNKLATMFWQNYDRQGGRAELRRTLSVIKKQITTIYLHIDRDSIGLKRNGVIIDVLQIINLRDTVRQSGEDSMTDTDLAELERILSLYDGNFMEGFSLPDSPTFDRWQAGQNAQIQDLIQSTLLMLAHSTGQTPEKAIIYFQQLIKLNPTYEEAYQELMRLYVKQDKRSEALRLYQQCVNSLEYELGVHPSDATQKLLKSIQQSSGDTLVIDSVRLSNSAIQASQLSWKTIGRENELGAIRDWLDDGIHRRLITITGSGGIGKTHLVWSLIENIRTTRIVYYISFEETPQDMMIRQIHSNLPFEPYSSANIQQQILDFLQNKSYLLVFDGVEHLTEVDQFIEKVIRYCPHIQMIVTSRRTLSIQGNQLIELSGLSYPQPDMPQFEAEAYEAYQLFIQATQEYVNDFSPSIEDKKSIVEICRLLQGLPLAITLVASWTRAMQCDAILTYLLDYLNNRKQLASDFTLMTPIEAVIGKSCSLLSPLEQDDLVKLSLFEGPFQQQVAHQITYISQHTLTKFVNYSLVSYDRKSDRYFIHNLLRQWLLRKIKQNDDLYATLKHDFVYYFSLLLLSKEKQLAERDFQTLSIIDDNLNSITRAWSWAISEENWQRVDEMLRGLDHFYLAKGYYHKGIQSLAALQATLEQIINVENETQNQLRRLLACTVARLAFFRYKLGEREQVRELLESYSSYFREIQDPIELANSLNSLGLTYFAQGEIELAITVLAEAKSIYQQHQIHHGLAHISSNLAISHYRRGDPDQMYFYLMEALQYYTEINDYLGIARICNNLGVYAKSRADWSTAKMYYERALRIQQQYGFDSSWEIACVCVNLGNTELQQQNPKLAQEHIFRAYILFNDLGHKPRTIFALFDLANLSAQQEQFIAAYRYLAEALNLSQQLDDPLYTIRTLVAYSQILIELEDYVKAAHYSCVLDKIKDLPVDIRHQIDTVLNGVKDQLESSEWQSICDKAQVITFQQQALLLRTEFLIL